MVYYMWTFRKAHLYFFMLKEREHFVDFLGDSTGLAHWDACGRWTKVILTTQAQDLRAENRAEQKHKENSSEQTRTEQRSRSVFPAELV